MGDEVKIDETKTLATDEEGKAVETPEGGDAAAEVSDETAGDGGETDDQVGSAE